MHTFYLLSWLKLQTGSQKPFFLLGEFSPFGDKYFQKRIFCHKSLFNINFILSYFNIAKFG